MSILSEPYMVRASGYGVGDGPNALQCPAQSPGFGSLGLGNLGHNTYTYGYHYHWPLARLARCSKFDKTKILNSVSSKSLIKWMNNESVDYYVVTRLIKNLNWYLKEISASTKIHHLNNVRKLFFQNSSFQVCACAVRSHSYQAPSAVFYAAARPGQLNAQLWIVMISDSRNLKLETALCMTDHSLSGSLTKNYLKGEICMWLVDQTRTSSYC